MKVLSLPAVAVFAAALFAADAAAQSHDSVAVMRAVGEALRGDARAILDRSACHDGIHPCRTRPGAPDPLIEHVAQGSGARLVSEEAVNVPCPWGYSPPREDAGFLISVAKLSWSAQGDTAHVVVLFHCVNRPGYSVHKEFGRDDIFDIARNEKGEWRVIGKRLTRITERSFGRPLSEATS